MKKALLAAALATLPIAGLRAQQPDEQRMVAGRVIDEHGAPLAGAAIVVIGRDEFVDVAALLRASDNTSDADGRFRVPATQKQIYGWLLAAADGKQALAHRLDWWEFDGTSPLADLVLVPGHRLNGRVRDADGRPVAGARIVTTSALRSQYNVDDARSGATSRSDGIFSVPCVPSEAIWLQITADDCLPRTLVCSSTSPLDLTLAPADRVLGRVVDADGTAVAGANVTIDNMLGIALSAPTDADGRFTLPTPRDLPFRVRAYRGSMAGVLTGTSDVLRGPQDALVIHAALATKPTRTVHVVARGSDGGAVLDRIRVRSGNDDEPQTAMLSLQHQTPTTYPGECDVVVPASDRQLLVEADGHGFALQKLPADDSPLTVTLGPECFITGVVIDEVTGAPMADVAVRVLPRGPARGNGQTAFGPPRTDRDGRFRIGGLRPGAYGVQAHVVQRLPSHPVACLTDFDTTPDLKVTVPAPILQKVEVGGVLVGGRPATRLRRGNGSGPMSTSGYFVHMNPTAAAVAVTSTGACEVGPLEVAGENLYAQVPSRLRAGTLAARMLDRDRDGGYRVDAADLEPLVVRGRIACDGSVPTDRLGLIAVPMYTPRGQRPLPLERWEACAGVDSAGGFAIELLPVPHQLQLVDLWTGLVVHREVEPYVPGTAPLILQPAVRVVEVRCVAEHSGDRLLLPPLQLRAKDANGESCKSDLQQQWRLPFAPGETSQRLLLGEGQLHVAIDDSSTGLVPAGAGWHSGALCNDDFAITASTTTIEIQIPAQPPLPSPPDHR